MPPPSAGASGGLGLLAPVPVPVGVLLWGLGVFPFFVRIRVALGETNLNGANSFEERFDVGDAVHTRMIPDTCVYVNPQSKTPPKFLGGVAKG